MNALKTIDIFTYEETKDSEDRARHNLDALTNAAQKLYRDGKNSTGDHPHYMFFRPDGSLAGELQPSVTFGLSVSRHSHVCQEMEPCGFVCIHTLAGEQLFHFRHRKS